LIAGWFSDTRVFESRPPAPDFRQPIPDGGPLRLGHRSDFQHLISNTWISDTWISDN